MPKITPKRGLGRVKSQSQSQPEPRLALKKLEPIRPNFEPTKLGSGLVFFQANTINLPSAKNSLLL